MLRIRQVMRGKDTTVFFPRQVKSPGSWPGLIGKRSARTKSRPRAARARPAKIRVLPSCGMGLV